MSSVGIMCMTTSPNLTAVKASLRPQILIDIRYALIV